MEGGPKGPMLNRRMRGLAPLRRSASRRLEMTYTSYTSIQPLGRGSREPVLLGVIAARREKAVVGSQERERRTAP